MIMPSLILLLQVLFWLLLSLLKLLGYTNPSLSQGGLYRFFLGLLTRYAQNTWPVLRLRRPLQANNEQNQEP